MNCMSIFQAQPSLCVFSKISSYSQLCVNSWLLSISWNSRRYSSGYTWPVSMSSCMPISDNSLLPLSGDQRLSLSMSLTFLFARHCLIIISSVEALEGVRPAENRSARGRRRTRHRLSLGSLLLVLGKPCLEDITNDSHGSLCSSSISQAICQRTLKAL